MQYCGERLPADIVVKATGPILVNHADCEFRIDEDIVDFEKRWTYKGMMYSGVPNLISGAIFLISFD